MHKKAITSMISFQDEEQKFLLVTGDKTGCVMLWDILKGHLICEFKHEHTAKVSFIALYNPKNTHQENWSIITTSDDKSVIVWNYVTKMNTIKINLPDIVTCLAVCIETHVLALATKKEKRIDLYNLQAAQQGILLKSIPVKHSDLILGAALLVWPPAKDPKADPKVDDLKIITVGWDKKMFAYNYSDGQMFIDFEKGHTKSITTLIAHYPTGEERRDPTGVEKSGHENVTPILITGSLDKTLVVWDFASRKKVRTLVGHKERITAVKISDHDDDGSPPIVISASDDCTIMMWDLSSGHKIRVIEYVSKLQTLALFDTAEGLTLFSSSDGKNGNHENDLLMWDLRKNIRTRTLTTGAVTTIDVVSLPGDEQKQILIGSVDNSFTFFDYQTGDKIEPPVLLHEVRINGAAIYQSPDMTTSRVISVDGSAIVNVWDLETRQSLQTLTGHSIVTLTVAVYDPALFGRKKFTDKARTNKSDDPKVDILKPCVLTSGGDKLIKVWSILDNQLVAEVDCGALCKSGPFGHSGFVRHIVIYHPVDPRDAPLFVSTSYDTTAILWDLETLKPMRRFAGVHTGTCFFAGIYDPATHYLPYPAVAEELPRDENHSRPALVLTSYDETFSVWDMLDGRKRLHIDTNGHKDSITALAVYTPSYGSKEDPLIVTGSVDCLIMIWNLFTGQKIQTLIGHTDRVCWITIHAPENQHPVLLSGGDDGRTIVWQDSLYQKPFMPLRESVIRAFDYDLTSPEDWPMITEMAKANSPLLFIEHSNLFMMAVLQDRPDFLLKFWDFLVLTLPTIKQVQYMEEKRDIFSIAILKCDLVSVFAISLAWIKNLNQDVDNILTQRFYHSSYFFPDKSLKLLAKYYPTEFVFFITSLRLVRSDKSLMFEDNSTLPTGTRVSNEVPRKFLDSEERLEFRGSNSRIQYYSQFWSNFSNLQNYVNDSVLQLGTSQSFLDGILCRIDRFLFTSYTHFVMFFQTLIDPQPVTGLMVPFKNCNEVGNYLKLFVQVSNQLDNVKIFESEIGLVMLNYFWHIRGRRVHVLAFIKYLLFFMIFLVTMYNYHPNYDNYPGLIFLACFCILGFVLYGYEEYAQLKDMASAEGKIKKFSELKWSYAAKHFVDLWNLVDSTIVLTGITALVLRLAYTRDTPTGRSFMAVTSVFMWFKILYFLRPFATSGPLGMFPSILLFCFLMFLLLLVAMILQIAVEIRTFLFVLFCVLAGFTQAFWILSNNDEENLFGTVSQSFMNTFLYMLGQNVVADFSGTASPFVANVFLVIFLITMMILMLNLLIALMGDVFSKVRSVGNALWRKEQASIILEEAFLFEEDKTIPLHLFVLKYSSEVANKPPDYEGYVKKLVESSDRKITKFVPDEEKKEEKKKRKEEEEEKKI
jgi:WD40 repeat protein